MGGALSIQRGNSNKKQLDSSVIYRVILMGDSVLDNFYWLEEKEKDLKYQLTKELQRYNKNSSCINLALDETEAHNILNGKIPAGSYVTERETIGMEPYKVDSKGKFFPLSELKKMILNDNIKPTHVVLSIGGNDCRVKLSMGKADIIFQAMKKDNFEETYNSTLKEIMSLIPNVIMVICYLPGNSFYKFFPDLKGEVKILAQRVAPILLDLARKYKLPVIDLSRTFNPDDNSHYGSTPIEPSNKSSKFICEHIMDVLSSFKFNEDESSIFYGIGDKKKKEINIENYSYSLI
jgi:hypothetical protein